MGKLETLSNSELMNFFRNSYRCYEENFMDVYELTHVYKQTISEHEINATPSEILYFENHFGPKVNRCLAPNVVLSHCLCYSVYVLELFDDLSDC